MRAAWMSDSEEDAYVEYANATMRALRAPLDALHATR